VHPTTSQPSPDAFATLYKTLLANPDDQVVGLHISSKLSGTLQSATLAAKDFDPARVHLVDTESVSGGLQLLVRASLDDIQAGDTAAAVAAKATRRRSNVTILVLLDTLTYLHRGGRIGRAQAFLGSLLNVKPLIAIRDGEVVPVARPRSWSKGVEMIVEGVRGCAPLRGLAEFHAATTESMVDLKTRLSSVVSDVSPILGRIGPVVGAYSGPGGLGVACLGAD
jgi:DegV family protein with EDD domain